MRSPAAMGANVRHGAEALRDLLTRRSAWRGWERAADNRIHSQAAGEDPRAPEGSCEAKYYGSAGVYLIESLK